MNKWEVGFWNTYNDESAPQSHRTSIPPCRRFPNLTSPQVRSAQPVTSQIIVADYYYSLHSPL